MDAILFGYDKQKIEQGESWSVLDLFEYSLTQCIRPSCECALGVSLHQKSTVRYTACYICRKLPPSKVHCLSSTVCVPLFLDENADILFNHC